MIDSFLRPVKGATVSKDSWRTAAWKCEELADAVSWLILQSLDTVLSGNLRPEDDEDAYSQAPSFMRSLMRARFRAEASLENTNSAITAGDEYACLIQTLTAWQGRLNSQAALYRGLAADVRPGRPPTKARLNRLSHLNGLAGDTKPSRKTAGRKRLVQLNQEELLQAVDRFAARNLSQGAVLEEIAREYLNLRGQRATGERLSEVTKNLKRRIAEAKRERRKSPA